MTLEEIENIVNAMTKDAIDGRENALKVFIQLKGLKSYIDDSMKAIEPSALTEAEKYDGQEYYGNLIRYSSGNTRWKYSHSDKYNKINDSLKKFKELMKQAAKNDVDIVDEDGVVIEPAIETSTKPFIKLEQPKEK